LHFVPQVLGEDVLVRASGLQPGHLQHLTVEEYVLPKLFVDAAGQRLLRRRNGLARWAAVVRLAGNVRRQTEKNSQHYDLELHPCSFPAGEPAGNACS
jgi:hypothetical protein